MTLPELHALRSDLLLRHIEISLRIDNLSTRISDYEKAGAISLLPLSEQKRMKKKYQLLSKHRLERFRVEQEILEMALEIKKLRTLSRLKR